MIVPTVNADTVTNGVYLDAAYNNPAFVASLDGAKITGQVASAAAADVVKNGVYTTGSDIATSRQLVKQRPRQLTAFLMALSEGTWIGRNNKELTIRIYRKYMKIDDQKLLESMHKNYLLGSIPVRPFPNEEAIQNDIEDLSSSLPHLRGKKAAEFLDLSLLKNMEEEGFFKRLQAK